MSSLFWDGPLGNETQDSSTPERRPRVRSAADPWLSVVVGALVVAGLVMVYSASSALGAIQFHDSSYYIVRQAQWLLLGMVALAVFRRLDYHRLRPLAAPGAIAVGVLMVLVLVPHIGYSANGAQRWFQVGSILFQPAELSKLAAVIFLARWVERRGELIRDLERGVLPFAIMVGAAALVLVVGQKDLGTAVVLLLVMLSVFLVGGARTSHVGLVLGGAAVAFLAVSLAEPYRWHRLLSFANPFSDRLNTGFQAVQSVIALGSGGLTGVGLGQSIQKYMWLPEAHTDFIFAIVGEEWGLIGSVGLLSLFALLAWRGYRSAFRAPDLFGMLIATGITTWFCSQALINIAAVTDSVPITGIPLPFVSYGGTSLAACLAAVGILMNISAQGQKVAIRKRETADLGGRHGRPHLSRLGRRPDPED
ncbi:MAG: putative lipid II flippase FtsW [Candidatus Dormibacteria bacterium]